MAEKETENEPKDLVEATPEEMEKMEKDEVKSVEERVADAERAGVGVKQEKDMTFAEKRAEREKVEQKEKLAAWVPKTQIGKDVKTGKEKDIDAVLDGKKKVLEPEVFDYLLQLENDLISIGQAKGKFGGGKRRAWRQTQKKTKEGNILTFSAMAVVGDKKNHVGLGQGKAKETLPAREKAIRNAKLNLVKINRGCGAFNCSCDKEHSLPFVVEGKAGSIRIKLIPAAQGTGLVIGDEGKKILRLAGVKDVYGVSKGHVRTTFNYVKALMDALSKTRVIDKLEGTK
jgi:small subunit ribosomal protein S5